MNSREINKKFATLFDKLSSDDFLKMKNLSGEIPFHVFTFESEVQVDVDKAISGLMVNEQQESGDLTYIYVTVIQEFLHCYIEWEPNV